MRDMYLSAPLSFNDILARLARVEQQINGGAPPQTMIESHNL
jgi:hypothetical protein